MDTKEIVFVCCKDSNLEPVRNEEGRIIEYKCRKCGFKQKATRLYYTGNGKLGRK